MIVIPHLRTRKGNIGPPVNTGIISDITKCNSPALLFLDWGIRYTFATDLVIHVSQVIWNDMTKLSEKPIYDAFRVIRVRRWKVFSENFEMHSITSERVIGAVLLLESRAENRYQKPYKAQQ